MHQCVLHVCSLGCHNCCGYNKTVRYSRWDESNELLALGDIQNKRIFQKKIIQLMLGYGKIEGSLLTVKHKQKSTFC